MGATNNPTSRFLYFMSSLIFLMSLIVLAIDESFDQERVSQTISLERGIYEVDTRGWQDGNIIFSSYIKTKDVDSLIIIKQAEKVKAEEVFLLNPREEKMIWD